MRFRVRRLSEVDSTNTLVKRAIDEGEPEGLAVRADRQTGGYGRQGRAWQSPEGGLYFSLLLRPDVAAEQLPTLALLAGIAVRRALAHLAGGQAADRIKLKWPNDIVVARPEGDVPAINDADAADAVEITDGTRSKNAAAANAVASSKDAAAVESGSSSKDAAYAKLCGISSEARKGAVCVGIGVNVYPPAEGAAVGVASAAVAVSNMDTPAAVIPVAGAPVADAPVSVAGVTKNAPAYLADCHEAHGFASMESETAEGFPSGFSTQNIGKASEAFGIARGGSCAPYLASDEKDLRDRAFSLILEEFAPLYEQWCAEGFAPFAEEYARHDALRGRRIDVVDRSGSPLASGVASGVGADGCLLVASADGTPTPVASGEAHIL